MLFDDECYAEIGRVTVAATMIDFVVVELLRLMDPSQPGGHFGLMSLLTKRAGPLRDKTKELLQANGEPNALDALAWVQEADAIITQRHRLVHAVWLTEGYGPERRIIGVHPQNAEEEFDGDLASLRAAREALEEHGNKGLDVYSALRYGGHPGDNEDD